MGILGHFALDPLPGIQLALEVNIYAICDSKKILNNFLKMKDLS